MRHHSATANHEHTGGDITFQEAARMVGIAWRKKYGRVPAPALSHALSDYDGFTWKIIDAEAGELVAIVVNGQPVLTDDIDDLMEMADGLA